MSGVCILEPLETKEESALADHARIAVELEVGYYFAHPPHFSFLPSLGLTQIFLTKALFRGSL